MILLILTDMAMNFPVLGILSNMSQVTINNQRFIKIAHRGASAYEPENTLLSFKRAIEMSADMIEFDVRLSNDGRLVIMHDERVDRTTNGNGLVREKTLCELRRLDAGKGERVPMLEEVIDLAKRKTGFVIELKEPGTEEGVIRLVKENGLIGDVFIVSFHQDLIKRVKDLEPRIRTGLILYSSPDPITLANNCLADAVAPFHNFVVKDLIQEAHNSNLILITWTVDSREEAEKLKDMRVDGIVTNKPDVI
jgi:glycerophosphoryl diester phosphodiesterase